MFQSQDTTISLQIAKTTTKYKKTHFSFAVGSSQFSNYYNNHSIGIRYFITDRKIVALHAFFFLFPLRSDYPIARGKCFLKKTWRQKKMFECFRCSRSVRLNCKIYWVKMMFEWFFSLSNVTRASQSTTKQQEHFLVLLVLLFAKAFSSSASCDTFIRYVRVMRTHGFVVEAACVSLLFLFTAATVNCVE